MALGNRVILNREGQIWSFGVSAGAGTGTMEVFFVIEHMVMLHSFLDLVMVVDEMGSHLVMMLYLLVMVLGKSMDV